MNIYGKIFKHCILYISITRVENVLDEKERKLLRKCIECEEPEMEIIDADMLTLSCPTREMGKCWDKV